MVLGDSFERRDSGKRRRLSERRRAFSRLSGRSNQASGNRLLASQHRQDSQQSSSNWFGSTSAAAATPDEIAAGEASELGAPGSGNIAMKIQFHIRVAPENEPLILDTNWPPLIEQHASTTSDGSPCCKLVGERKQSDASIGDHQLTSTDDRLLARQSSSSTKRRQQLLAMHKLSAGGGASGSQAEGGASLSKQRDDEPPSSALGGGGGGSTATSATSGELFASTSLLQSSEDNIVLTSDSMQGLIRGSSLEKTTTTTTTTAVKAPSDAARPTKIESGPIKEARSSTITDGMPTDEATMLFLARHQYSSKPRAEAADVPVYRRNTLQQLEQQQQQQRRQHQQTPPSAYGGSSGALFEQREERDHIYFKRDGQRFGHEFTLKLAVERTYRCLLKVRPLIPLQSILIQGQPVQFVDCTSQPGGAFAGVVSPLAAGSSSAFGLSMGAHRSAPSLSKSWQNIQQVGAGGHQARHSHTTATTTSTSTATKSSNHHHHNHYHNHNHHHNHQLRARLNHAQTVGNVSRPDSSMGSTSRLNEPKCNTLMCGSSQLEAALLRHQLRQEQQSQMLRSFAGSHSSSSSNSHLGTQLVYMFDWSASQFEVNKNKLRTLVQTVLKFKNGQMLTLPLQVKFYPSAARQHLNWGSQLHFIDYDCTINDMGAINVDRVQYY